MENFQFGFIGLGTMGESMCENILKKSGKKVLVFDVNAAQMDKLAQKGAEKGKDIQEVAEKANLIFIMVPKSEHVEAVIKELLVNLKPNTIIVDMSTISPKVSRTLAEKVKAKGATMLDAPVVKSKSAAIDGTLGIYVGGDMAVIEQIKPILLYMGAEVIYYGANGNGLIMKLLHNMLVGQIQNGVNELLATAETVGIDFDLVMKGIRAGGGQNFYLDGKGPTIKKGDFSPKFSVQNMHKDVWLHKEMIDEMGLKLPGSDHVRLIYDKAMKSVAAEDFSATYKIVKNQSK